jgi:hypothetical protein
MLRRNLVLWVCFGRSTVGRLTLMSRYLFCETGLGQA